MSSRTKILLFKARNWMLNVANNYGRKDQCPLCKINQDSQQHLIECLIIKITCPEIYNNVNIRYEDLYSDNTTKQKQITKLFETAIRKREEILQINEKHDE